MKEPMPNQNQPSSGKSRFGSAMMLSQSAETWVNQTLERLTVEEKVGRLLVPMLSPTGEWSDPNKEFKGIKPGGVHVFAGTAEELRAATARVQACCGTPTLITGDMECGAGRVVRGGTLFPEFCSLAATGDEALAYAMGEAVAVEGRACGYHWSFSPVVDINGTPYSPIVNTRGFGDDPEKIVALSVSVIRGMQEHGMIATAKHFPGDGFDDRDQHICTTVNPLNEEDWFRWSGRMFQAAIDAGVMSIMVGHIALPFLDPGDDRRGAPPATVSRRIITDLLREKMGFEGIVVTDAMNMSGITQWADRESILAACVNAGCDMLLFPDTARDHAHLLRALEAGRISEERLDQSIRRVLRIEARMGLHEQAGSVEPPSAETSERFEVAARTVAEKALTVVRERSHVLPLNPGPGKKVLSFHVRSMPEESHVDDMDRLLAATGAEVVRATEADLKNLPTVDTVNDFEALIIHFVFCPRWMTNRIRPNGTYMGAVAGLIGLQHPRTIVVSFGSPYVHHEVPAAPTYINAYSCDLHTQQAVLKLLRGEIEAVGVSPVDLDAHGAHNRLAVRLCERRV